MNKFFTGNQTSLRHMAPTGLTLAALLGIHFVALPLASQDFPPASFPVSYHPETGEEIAKLRQQLQEKTQELHTYKANLFRPSHPQDQATINKLSQQIAEKEREKQELVAKIQNYETELAAAKKQITNLEVSADALTAFIQNQRAVVEAKKQELTAKMRAYEEDPQLDQERELNKKLTAELQSLKESVISYERQIKELEIAHEQELHDALQDAAMLKFELADARLSADRKEHELMLSTLHDLTLALDHSKSIKAHQTLHQEQLDETEKNIASLQAALQQAQHDKDHLISQYAVERHVLENTISEHSEIVSHALIAQQLAIKDYVNDLLSQSEEKTDELQQAIHSLTQIAEHQDHALAEANSAFSRVQEYNQYLEMENSNLKNRLHQLELAERPIPKKEKDNSKKTAFSPIPPALQMLLKQDRQDLQDRQDPQDATAQ